MKTCVRCGNTYPDQFVACPADGTALSALPPAPNFAQPMPVSFPPSRKGMSGTAKVLLIVGGVLAALGVIVVVILVFVAVPNFRTVTMKANQTAAISLLNTIYRAQIMYQANYPANGYAPTLAALGGDPKQGPPSPTAAQLLEGDLGAGVKDGYVFNIGNLKMDTSNNTDRITGFEITAVPTVVGKTGNRGYCIHEDGEITIDPNGGTNCTQSMSDK